MGNHPKVKVLETCPVTNGLPTTMTLAGFETACARIRNLDRNEWADKKNYKYTWCQICQGKQLPKELRVVKLDQLKKQRAVRQYQKYRKSREMLEHSPAR